ncbi:N-acetylglucosamine-6-phosphate deacetylase [Algoriphagus terrigena]|uniref:N-acetylglucosamine-6-phosphate deacetylase n=1 Tax=Algoriphagus terrigena TaxID=344884 RepID=UPI000425FBCA|nr:N-acetylglucosamine-6-phosphate deacetylase [Algoriphagus terrigena]
MEDCLTLHGRSYRDGKPMEIEISGGLITSVKSTSKELPDDIFLGPGITDIQVNGYLGQDYNSLTEDILALGQISQELLKAGVTTHFPTLITNSPDQISKLIKQVVLLRKKDPTAFQSIAGLHIEGPFISSEDGPRGAHPREFVQAPDWSLFQSWIEESEDLIRMVTLSPEWEGSRAFIKKCVENGILVSIGHTNATHEQISEAVKAGARLSTHLGNGAHQLLARHPNYLWSQLAEEKLSATVIADGFHLPAEVIQVFKKVKGKNLLLVSDSTSLAGMPPGDYDLHIGGQVTLTSEGKLHMRSNPKTLAGSAMNLLQGVNFLLKHELATMSEAWEMASVRPMMLFNPDFDPFQPGQIADLILVRKLVDNQLKLVKTIKNGREVYSL